MATKKISKRCPRCSKPLEGHPALSRRDNQSDICSSCGTEEAMVDMGIDSLPGSLKRELKYCWRLIKVLRIELRN